jgi:hypothetical protein
LCLSLLAERAVMSLRLELPKHQLADLKRIAELGREKLAAI